MKFKKNDSIMKSETSMLNEVNNCHDAIAKNLKIRDHYNFIASVNNALSILSSRICYDYHYSFVHKRNDYYENLVPRYLSNFVTTISIETGYDHLSSLMGLIGIASIAMNGKYKVNMETWQESVSLYQFFIAASSDRKSGFINMLKEPLIDVIREHQKDYDEKIAAMKDKSRFIIKTLNQSRSSDVKEAIKIHKAFCAATDKSILKDFCNAIFDSYEEQTKEERLILELKRPCLFTNEFTKGGLESKLADFGAIAVCDSEPGFIESLNKNDDKDSLRLILLRAYSGDHYSRATASKSIEIDCPRVNILVSTQYGSVIEFYNRKAYQESGFLGRFLPIFINPDAYPILDSNADLNYKQQHELMKNNLCETIRYLYLINSSPKTPVLVEVSDKAKELNVNFRHHNDWRAKNSHKHMAPFMGKLHGTAARLACVLMNLDFNRTDFVINDTHMSKAIEIANELVEHTEYLTGPFNLRVMNIADRLEQWYIWNNNNNPFFSYREAKQALSSSVKPEELQAALELLIRYNHLLKIPGEKRAFVYVVHPGLLNPPTLPSEYQIQNWPFNQPANLNQEPIFGLNTAFGQQQLLPGSPEYQQLTDRIVFPQPDLTGLKELLKSES
jgi:hypothetical protein